MCSMQEGGARGARGEEEERASGEGEAEQEGVWDWGEEVRGEGEEKALVGEGEVER